MTMDGRMLFLLVLLPFIGSVITGLFRGADRSGSAWFTAAIALVAFILTASLYPIVSDGKVLRGTVEWLPAYGLNVTLRMDGFAWLFAMLITGIGLLVVIYARCRVSSLSYCRLWVRCSASFCPAISFCLPSSGN
jgi:multicomponent K+:H+ antiporter subunit A